MAENKELSSGEIIREIVDAIVKETSVTTINVQHDATIQGKTGDHQVDVYWEFTDGDIVYKTVVQTRYWDKTVGRVECFNLAAIIRDLSGQTAGVLFTQPVYQKDIKDMTSTAGIILYELRAPAEQGILEPIIENVRVNVDVDWVRAEKARLGLGEEPIACGGDPKYSFLYNEQGNCVDSVQGIFDVYVTKREAGVTDKQIITHTFDKPAFLQTYHESIPFVKLQSIAFELEFYDFSKVRGEDMVRNILENVLRYYAG